MLSKRSVYTNITPIPHSIPRQLAIDILHSHSEVITLNPLVLEHHPIKAPRDAAADEFYATWYEITQRIQFVPGIGKMGSGKISFKGVFHDMPWGLQTHVYAPMNVDLRNKWRIAGNQPGEPPETQELGLGAPSDGLYLREDIEIKCNVTMISFVKAELKAASKVMVERMVKKAELLDSGVLHAMMEEGKLRTINPADKSNVMRREPTFPVQPQSPRLPYYQPEKSPTLQQQHEPSYHASPPQQHQQSYPNLVYGSQAHSRHPSESAQAMPMELPGDFYYTSLPPPPPSKSPYASPRASTMTTASEHYSDPSSRPTSYASTSDGGMRSPGLEQKAFAAELPTHAETREEYSQAAVEKMREIASQPQNRHLSADGGAKWREMQQEQQERPAPLNFRGIRDGRRGSSLVPSNLVHLSLTPCIPTPFSKMLSITIKLCSDLQLTSDPREVPSLEKPLYSKDQKPRSTQKVADGAVLNFSSNFDLERDRGLKKA
ncbi:hypothetical protein M501DRAFT_988936 [Patellaria atrata CBS 101060]|uniref:DUF7053 domain-containing protein n=1 Tax=Patellaria atrata CBS 101060 TaxID=1346257 RepID=A0A9P4VPE9_9PEZI|nr:hypothetical protein M501DRAFT_988936 [Patellaria atrata CBS 101060]